jgi:hypothetical protein
MNFPCGRAIAESLPAHWPAIEIRRFLFPLLQRRHTSGGKN